MKKLVLFILLFINLGAISYLKAQCTAVISANPNPICVGNSLYLGSKVASTYLWSGPNGFTSTEQSPVIPITGTNQGGVYSLTIIDSVGCKATATRNVTVNPLPIVTVTATPHVCSGGILQLIATGGGTYKWSGPEGFTSTLPNPVRTAALTKYSGEYLVTVTSAAGCSAVNSVNAIIDSLPLPVVNVRTVTNPVCSGQTATLYANGAPNYRWSTGDSSAVITISPTTATTYTVTGTADGCSATASIAISVNPSPTVSINPATIEICVNDTITLSGAGGTRYIWSTGKTTGSVKVSPRETSTYTITGYAANGCSGKATATVTVKDFEAGVTTSKVSICEGETITLTAIGGTAYSWTPGNASGSSINVRPNVSTNYKVRITGANGCVKYLEIFIEVFPKPIIYINDIKSIVAPPICSGTELDLRAGGAYSYLWTPDSIPGRIISVSPKATTRYTVTGSNIWGCTSTASINIPVFAPTSARIESSTGKDPICKGKELTLTVVGLTKPVWWPGKQTTTSITILPKDIVYAEVTGFDANGCQVTLVFEARTILCKGPGLINPDSRSQTINNTSIISPNPMGQEAILRFDTPLIAEANLQIFSIDGCMVRNIKLSKNTDNYLIERGSLQNGVYFYRIADQEGYMTQIGKLVIL